jgi:hypothetical protein
LCAYLGEGSTVYRRPFEDRERFGRLMAAVEAELKARIAAVDISSYSAGYGAVRELVKSERYLRLMRRVVLCDSMYGSFEAGTTRPAMEHIEPWVPLARAAMRGEKTLVLTYSQVPTASYASTAQCAHALASVVGVKIERVATAAQQADYPLRERGDVGGFHVWGYEGSDAMAHMTHARRLADVWKALDAAGEK